MFSFFKRGKTKEDQKDKPKEKSSYSPFSKRHDASKKDNASASSHPQPICDFSLIDDQSASLSTSRECSITDTHVADTETQHTCSVTQEIPITEQTQHTLSSVTADSVTRGDFERAGSNGSSDQTDSEIGFKTPPNTPLLPQHSSVVPCELVIDSTDSLPLVSPPSTELPSEVINSADSISCPAIEEPFLSSEVINSADSISCPAIEEPFLFSEVDSADPTADRNKTPPQTEQTTELDWCEPKANRSEMCEEESRVPGELYDIEEEETSDEDDDEDDDDEDDDDSGNVTQPTIEEEYPEEIFKKNCVNDEARDFASMLSAKERESNHLLNRIEDLQRDVMVKAGCVDRLQAELSAACKESEVVRKKLRKLEEDLSSSRQKNEELTEELKNISDKNENNENEGFDFNHLLTLEEQVKELSERGKELESQVHRLRQERDKLDQQVKQLKIERDEGFYLLQQALDQASSEKLTMQDKFEKEFEKLRTVNTDREQHLLEDFEWKLREVEQACKKRLEEKERLTKQRIKTAEDKLKLAEEDLAQMERLKQFEVEAEQLRGLNLEQQRALRFAERTKEQLQVSEKVLQEELKKLKELLEKEKNALTTMQAIHNREIDEKERKMRFRLEQQKTEINSQWEEKLQKETIRLKVECDQNTRDEKRMLAQALRLEKEKDLEKIKEEGNKQIQDLLKEIEKLKNELDDEEQKNKQNIETIRSNADRDMFDLRRKLDRIDLSYQERIEKIQSEHENEKERMVEEHERKLQICEQNWQLQLGSTRTTLELVKEQLKREASDREQSLKDSHNRELDEQWERLMQEKETVITQMKEQHISDIEKMKSELENVYKCHNSREQELLDTIARMRQEIYDKTILIDHLLSQTETLQGDIKTFGHTVSLKESELVQAQEETNRKLRLMEESHSQTCTELTNKYKQEMEVWKTSNKQLEERIALLNNKLEESKSEKLIEDLRRSLSEKEHQVAQLSKEKHLYQLELMNSNCQGGPVTAHQRKKGGRAKPNRPGTSRGIHK